ncbi:putative adenylate cyclase [Chondrus crispus]|uniref:Putative adenylate cyclase n=1 Tax=Chondrus crispus TaxID=2769 RepID=R7Q8V3_CHOCR|nr:putative adenylate cyclase [Chondrus crispus]CDF34464.1 putative adenylate cyclase [Chondrus crispus]|eukprot:XP_005714283.1 putative adenylate cyclase [Chondrus crispus]
MHLSAPASTALQAHEDQARGYQIAQAILPPDLLQCLAEYPAGRLSLQISRALVKIPFEVIVDLTGPWQSRFSIVRTLSDLELPDAEEVQSWSPAPDDRLLIDVISDGESLQERQAWDDALMSCGLSGLCEPNDPCLIIANDSKIAQEHFRRTALPKPIVWIWPTTGEDIEAVALLTGHGHAVLALDVSRTEQTMLQAGLPLLAACARGQPIPEAIRQATQTEACPGTPWRAYNVPYRLFIASTNGRAKLAHGENRQVTALSLDLAGSTSLIQALGSEGYSEMLSELHQICVDCAEERGGVQYGRLGDDSSMIVFGLPRALEDAAQRAMTTALAMQRAIAALPGSPKLRIGIATGRVSVHQDVPYGQTVHLAARLQALGDPGDVIVDATSRSLSQQEFVFGSQTDYQVVDTDLGQLSGATLLGSRESQQPLPAAAALAPFVAREAELADIKSYWHRSCAGEVIALTLRGEAGIGKTRLIREFLQTVDGESALIFQIRGLPDFQRSPFRSLIDALERGYQLQSGDSTEHMRLTLEKGTALPVTANDAVLQLVVLLGMTPASSAPGTTPNASKESGEKLRADIFETVYQVVMRCARTRPLAVVVEDMQWVDHSTLEALTSLFNRVRDDQGLPIFFLTSAREGTQAMELPDTNVLEIEKLSHAASRWLVREIGGEKLSANAIDRLAKRANGIPLFLEESAKIAVDTQRGPEDWQTTVPESLDALLMTRLDHAGQDAKSLAQVASVLGRGVPVALLETISKDAALPVSVGVFDETLLALESSGIVYRSETATSARLSFKHELLRDVAYSSMWVRDRNTIHALTVSYLETSFSDLVRHQPDTLAYHYRASGQYADAAREWEKAATLAAATSANMEAIDHLNSAIESQNQVSPTIDSERAELRLQLKLAARLIASDGYGAALVEQVYARAEALARRLEDSAAKLKAQLGLESVYVMRGKLRLATTLARSVLETAVALVDEGANPAMLMQARWALANVLFHSGQSTEAMLLFEKCLAEYRADMHQPHAVQDPGVMCLCYSAWALWEMGYADQAKSRIEEVVSLAGRLKHKFSEAQAHGFAASLCLFRGELDQGLSHAERSIQISEESGFSVWFAHATIIRGRLRALTNRSDDSIAEMSKGYQLWASTGAVITCPFYLALIAETHLEREQIEAAKTCVDQALQIIESSNEMYHKAELLRLSGQIAYAKGEPVQGQALVAQAISLSNEQNKPAFALRASMVASERLSRNGHHEQARLMINQAIEPFSEGFDTADLLAAKYLQQTQSTQVISPSNSDGSEHRR